MPVASLSATPAVQAAGAAPRPAVAFRDALQARLPAPAAPSPAPGPIHAGLAAVERAQRRLDSVLTAARAGRTFTAGELLGLQAEAYRAVQVVDLAGKLVEQGAQSVRQALNTQL